MTVSLELLPGYDHPAAILSLFTEYTQMLVSMTPASRFTWTSSIMRMKSGT